MPAPRKLVLFAGTSLSFALLASSASADVNLPPVLSSHMVLQRDMPVPVWGTAAPGEKVTVQFRAQTKTAIADADGKWLLKLDKLEAGGPDTLTVAGNNTLKLDDVLVGEVWVGSGQSNMALTAGGEAKDDATLAQLITESYPNVRLLGRGTVGWQASAPETNGRFSGLLFAFGVRLQKALNVPVGLMVGAVGGTPSGYWLSQEAFNSDEGIKKDVADYGPRYEVDLKTAQDALDKWKQTPAAAEPNAKPPVTLPLKPGESPRPIGNLYEVHIRPLIPFGIRGVLWDQGEAGTGVGGVDQYTLMGGLISGWRKEWGQGDFPWIYVAKPSGHGTALDLTDPVTAKAEPFAPLPPGATPYGGDRRYTYIRIKEHPNTAMVTVSDLGGGTHPLNKAGYGARASRVALGFVYKAPVEIYGPTYDSMKIEGSQIRIKFTHVGQGLTTPAGKPLQGFAIAGEDKKWVWADCKIEGDNVVVSNPQVSKPVAVRYAWAYGIEWADLFNKDGLPALPFRTDSW